jgi:regulatory factor X
MVCTSNHERLSRPLILSRLRAVCKPAKTSVPRNRVYSQYATRCGTERVVPLNPASFGKLVRVIFPGIQTRRLGVRGESKYHYVDLALEEEPSAQATASWNGANFPNVESRLRRSESASTQQIDFNTMPRLPADTAAFPSIDGGFDAQSAVPPTPRGPPSQGRAFAWPDTRGMQQGTVESLSYNHILRFPSSNLPPFTENEPVSLPSIHPYLPHRTDIDTAEALAALYRTHCTSLIDSIRFCKEKQFFRLYTSFHGTLTVPVQKLFTHPNIAPWIQQCDLVMYRTMVRFVSRLTLQAAPVVVINILSNISANLHGHIAKTFSSQPAHVLEAKLKPAAVFASLLHRLIRVNQSAHAAANLLTIDQNREQMWFEWLTKVNPKRVMEAELPDCGYEEAYKILTSEMRSLLEPLQAPDYQDDPYGFQAYNFEENGSFASYLQGQMTRPNSGPSNVSTETILDRWSSFISSLPSRFPNAEARVLLHCISGVGTAALRDITIMNGQSYGHWWVLKIFVDEMSLWLAEMGGFLEPEAANDPLMRQGMQQSPNLESTLNGNSISASSASRMGSMAPDFGGDAHSANPMFPVHMQRNTSFEAPARPHSAMPVMNHPQPAMFMPQPVSHAPSQLQQETDIDDSGIGMGMMDDDLTMAKFNVGSQHIGGNTMTLPTGMQMNAL